MTLWIISSILVVTIFLLITEIIPIDLTAIGIIVALTATGVLDPQEALQGFANPAVIAVAAMFIISRGMMRTGALDLIGQRIIQYSKGNPGRILLMSLCGVAVSSAFLNNTPIVVLFISILMSVCCEYGLSPSRFMIPVSYASILAGTCTLIGTSTNILVSDLSLANGYGAIGMFELSALGVPIALLGILYLLLAAPRLMPGHKAPICELQDSEDRRYLAELMVSKGSKLIEVEPVDFFRQNYPSLEVFEVIRGPYIYFPDREEVKISEGDLLFVKASANDLVSVLRDRHLELAFGGKELDLKAHGGSLFVEFIIPPQSGLVGSKLAKSSLQLDPDIRIIAVKRRRVHYAKQKLRELNLAIGDILLVYCPKDHLDQIRTEGDLIIVEDVQHQIIHRKRAPIAIASFLGMIAAATAGLAGITVCAVSAVFMMLVFGCLQVREAYRSVDARVLMMVVGTLAMGAAMEKTGAAEIYAKAFLALLHEQNPTVVLGAVILMTSISTHVLSNNATAVLLLPIAVSTAITLGVNPKPFIIGICFGASACYATPIGYQTNLLVYGPGGYRFADYLKLGIPLNVLVLVMGSLFIPSLWPF
jgi:di/tricarboxylate transporter